MAPNFKRSLVDRAHARSTVRRGLSLRLQRFFTQEIWQHDLVPIPVVRRALRRASRLLFLAANGFVGDRCIVRASALTYVTVLSLVPLLAFSFATLKGLGFYETFRGRLIVPALERLLPAEEQAHGGSTEVPQAGALAEDAGSPALPPTAPQRVPPLRQSIEKLLDLVETTNLKGLAATGLVVVVWAVIRLLGTIEAALNEIWGVRRARSLVRKLTDYFAIVVIAPIFLVVAIGVTSATQTQAVLDWLDARLSVGFVIGAAARLAPLLAGWLVFSFVYLALPNTRTRVTSALFGGFFAGVLWQVALWAQVELQIGVAKYSVIYSTFAAIPIFLIWVQLSWVIVLLGAELAFAHQHEREYRRIVGWREATPTLETALGLRVLGRLTRAFLEGSPPLTAETMASALAIPAQPVDEVLEALEERGLVARAVREDEEHAWLVARDPERIRVVEVLEALEGELDTRGLAAPAGLDRAADRLLGQLFEERRGSAFNLSLQELVERGARLEQDADPAGLSEPGLQGT